MTARISDMLPLFEVGGLVSVYRQVRKSVLEHVHACSRRKLRDPAGVRAIELNAQRALQRALSQRFECGSIYAEGIYPYSSFGPGSPRMCFAVHVDGIENLVRDLDDATVSIAVVPPKSPVELDNVTMALVGTIGREQQWFGSRERGAFSNDGPLAVSTVSHPQDAMLSLDGLDDCCRVPLYWPAVGAKMRMLGSMALGLTRVAQGGLDAHVCVGRRLRPEEYLAAAFLVQQAGGEVWVADERYDSFAYRPTLVAASSTELLSQLQCPPTLLHPELAANEADPRIDRRA